MFHDFFTCKMKRSLTQIWSYIVGLKSKTIMLPFKIFNSWSNFLFSFSWVDELDFGTLCLVGTKLILVIGCYWKRLNETATAEWIKIFYWYMLGDDIHILLNCAWANTKSMKDKMFCTWQTELYVSQHKIHERQDWYSWGGKK